MEAQKILTNKTPTVLKSEQGNWVVKDDLGNTVLEGEQAFILENGATIHEAAIEDYLLEKLGAKVTKTEDTETLGLEVFLLKDGTRVSAENIEDYFIESLGAQVFQRVALNSEQK